MTAVASGQMFWQHSREPESGAPFPRLSLIVIVTSLILGGWSFLLLTWIEQANGDLAQRRQKITDSLHDLFQTEELIAMTVAGSVWTAESRWTVRYQGYLAQFNQRLATCVQYAPREARLRLAGLAKDAERRPVLMEKRIFSLATESKHHDARTLFESSDYRHMLENAHLNLVTFEQSIQESFDALVHKLNETEKIWKNIFWSSFTLLFVSALVFLSQISNWLFSLTPPATSSLQIQPLATFSTPLPSFSVLPTRR